MTPSCNWWACCSMKGFFFFANFEDIAGKLFRVSMDLSNNQSVEFDQKSERERSQSLKTV